MTTDPNLAPEIPAYLVDKDGNYFRVGGGGGAAPGLIDELDDVDTTTTLPQPGDVLTWSGTQWVPQASGPPVPDLEITVQTPLRISVRATISGVPVAGFPVSLQYTAPTTVSLNKWRCFFKETSVTGLVDFAPGDFSILGIPGWIVGDVLAFWAGEYLPVVGDWYIPSTEPARLPGHYFAKTVTASALLFHIMDPSNPVISNLTSYGNSIGLGESGVGAITTDEGLELKISWGFDFPVLASGWTSPTQALRMAGAINTYDDGIFIRDLAQPAVVPPVAGNLPPTELSEWYNPNPISRTTESFDIALASPAPWGLSIAGGVDGSGLSSTTPWRGVNVFTSRPALGPGVNIYDIFSGYVNLTYTSP